MLYNKNNKILSLKTILPNSLNNTYNTYNKIKRSYQKKEFRISTFKIQLINELI